MRIFFALCRRKHMPNGHIYRGKDRIVREVTWADTQKQRNDWEIEEANMFYLRHAFLTPEQSAGHSNAVQKTKERIAGFYAAKVVFKENVSIESRLGHLRFAERWE